jgi:2-(1,2-epoxy-1,2-dihydrophenyl)acetyl-CoA isomerase
VSSVIIERDGPVLVVRLNRPEVMNAIDAGLLEGLKSAWREASDSAIRAVVITGNGRAFCAGADLKAGSQGNSAGGLEQTTNPHVLALAQLDKAVICAVNGAAAGSGLSLACAGDLRIAAESAKFVPAFARIGVVPDAGASFYLIRLLGYARAFEFVCSDRTIEAPEALQLGLVNEVLPRDQLLDRAMERAHQFAAMPGRAIELTKRVLTAAVAGSLPEVLDLEARYQVLALTDPSRMAARAEMMAATLGGRPPEAAGT